MKKLFNFKDIGCLVIILLMAVQLNAQNDITPEHFQHDDKHFIGAHNNHKYFQEFINVNGHTYMYYNKTYNNKSKELTFYEITFDEKGNITDRSQLMQKDKEFSKDLHFEKINYMRSAIFTVDNYIFIPVSNIKNEKMQMYRYDIGNNRLDIVDLDQGENSINYCDYAISSGYDVLLFCDDYIYRYTFEIDKDGKPYNNLTYKEALSLQTGYYDPVCISAVATTDSEGKDIALAVLSNAVDNVDLAMFSINPLTYKSRKATNIVSYQVEIALGRSMGLEQRVNNITDGAAYFSLFYTDNDPFKNNNYKHKPYYKRFPINYIEVAFDDNDFYMDDTVYEIALSSNNFYAKKIDDALIDIVDNYIPIINTDGSGNNGFQKQHILVNCDYKNETNFSMLSSDRYVINPNERPAKTDFSRDSTWKQTWSLLGIVDGAPPCAINWELWESLHFVEKPPTILSFDVSEEDKKTTTITTEKAWSFGVKGNISAHFEATPLSLKMGASASGAHINENTNETTKTIELENFNTIELNEYNQDYAVWYWAAPEIHRIAYSTYDWKDSQYKHPINDMIDYAFITTRNIMIEKQVPISDGPHFIFSPNDTTMKEWISREDVSNDTTIGSHALEYGITPYGPHYIVHQTGTSASVTGSTEQTTEQTETKEMSFEGNAGISIPDVFKIGVNGGYDYKYTKSSTISTTVTESVTLDLTNLTNAYHTAIYPQSLYINSYLFMPDSIHEYWYYGNPAFLGSKPFYLAYTVSELSAYEKSKMLSLLEPFDNNVFYSGETVHFIWNDELQKSKLIISKEPTNSLKSIIYHGNLNKNSFDGVSALDIGDYYWRVAGISDNGEPVWSEFRKFSIVEKDIISDNNKSENIIKYNSLPAVVYPNPTLNQNVTLTYEVKDELSPIEFILYDISGRKLWEKKITNQDAAMYSFEIPVGGILTHFGVLKVFNGKYVASKKIVVY